MGLLDSFESKLDRTVNGAFAKAFKSEVQPVEIAANLQRELDSRAAVVSRARTVVPNAFIVELSSPDFTRLSAYDDAVTGELIQLVSDYAGEQRYAFVGPVTVTLEENADHGTGVIRIRSEVVPGPMPGPAPPPEVSGQPYLEAGGARYPLGTVTRMGRGTDTDIRVDDPGASRHHAEITLGTQVTIRDLGSTNGTLVNGRMISTAVLTDGAKIQFGSTILIYRAR